MPVAGETDLKSNTMTEETGLETLRGIGPSRAADLRAAGLLVLDDLLTLPPRRYEDRIRFPTLEEVLQLPPGVSAAVLLHVRQIRLIRTRRKKFSLVQAELTDGHHLLKGIWFNQPYLARHLPIGRRLIVYGVLEERGERDEVRCMKNPEIELLPKEGEPFPSIHTGRIVPVYRRIGRLSPRLLRQVIHQALESGSVAKEFLPAHLVDRHHLLSRQRALLELHFPPPHTSLELLEKSATAAQKRLIYEELILLVLALRLASELQGDPGRTLCIDSRNWLARVDGLFPGSLTPGQQQALAVIFSDLSASSPMARLLQGDVGCGKTRVAAAAMLAVVESGHQAILMAPTEVLAGQHRQSLSQLLTPAGHEVGILTGSQSVSVRRRTLERMRQGGLRLVVGTHALFQAGVDFQDLGLVVIDEQQRFGVAQRLKLFRKGPRPHLLVMTATPIPRSLALVLHGNLDKVEIHDQPARRGGITTKVVMETDDSMVWSTLRREVAAGHQAFVVCPRVEAADQAPTAAARQLRNELAHGELSGMEIGLLHGQMPPQEREEILANFMAGTLQVLVCTTIIEVGIDAGNATVLVVEEAHRFGLSQLHQLRGRVGRSGYPSYCFLMRSSRITDEGARRLEILAGSTDGFAIARYDLANRGPGEMLGLRQRGSAGLRLADLVRDEALLEEAQADANELWAAGLDAHLRRIALRRFRIQAAPREAG